jgi:hypothetical protein
MADIKVDDIKLDGSDFFANGEGFMKDLAEDELDIIGAGKNQSISSTFTIGTTSLVTVTHTVVK